MIYKEKEEYIEWICAMSMNHDKSKEIAEKELNEILNEMESDGIDFNNKDFKELFKWYALGKPNKKSMEDCKRAIKKVVPNINEEELYRMTGFLISVAYAKGGGDNYDEYLSYAEAYFSHKKMGKIIREMIPNKSNEEYSDLENMFSREFYKDVKDYRDKKEFNELEFRDIINKYKLNSK